MSYIPQKELKKLLKNSEGYVEVLVDTSRVERVIGELSEKFDLAPVVDLENLSRVNFENLAAKYDQLVKSSNHLVEIYGKMVPVMTQVLDRIQGLESQLAKINEDNNLWGTVSKSVQPYRLANADDKLHPSLSGFGVAFEVPNTEEEKEVGGIIKQPLAESDKALEKFHVEPKKTVKKTKAN